jgi:hypothetical protein
MIAQSNSSSNYYIQTFSTCSCQSKFAFEIDGGSAVAVNAQAFCCDDVEVENGPGGGPNGISRFPQWLQFPMPTTRKF